MVQAEPLASSAMALGVPPGAKVETAVPPAGIMLTVLALKFETQMAEVLAATPTPSAPVVKTPAGSAVWVAVRMRVSEEPLKLET